MSCQPDSSNTAGRYYQTLELMDGQNSCGHDRGVVELVFLMRRKWMTHLKRDWRVLCRSDSNARSVLVLQCDLIQ